MPANPAAGNGEQIQANMRVNRHIKTMKRLVKHIIATLARLIRQASGITNPNPRPACPPRGPEADEIEFCCCHGAFPVRRRFKARGVSAHGYEFTVLQCPAPRCGEFVAWITDPVTGQHRVLFRGHHFTPHRERQRPASFHPIRATNPAT
jgi:hypothetical protein